ncbi:hypothetical protein [Devosia sp.]|jgi:hypothetical protein|uniref:hypothetical protein n=1 Tax=Devosia sp. TaxID=1871048 RepID=UPI0037C0B2D5
MADAIVSGDDAARKNPTTPNSLQTTVSLPAIVRRLPCLIDLRALTPDTQVKIFALIDKTGSATMAELVAALETIEAPAGLIVDMAVMGVLEIEARRFLDGSSLVRRAPTPVVQAPVEQASPELPAKSDGVGECTLAPHAAVADFYVPVDLYEPSIYFVEWDGRGALKYNPSVNGAGVYLGIFEEVIHVGKSKQLDGRLRNGKHVLYNGKPPRLLVVITDAGGQLGDVEALALERRMALAVVNRDHRGLANEMPNGHQLPRSAYEAIDRLAEKAVAAIAELGLAFTNNQVPALVPQTGMQFRLDACGVKATATQTAEGFVVHEGSQVRLDVAPSAGSGPLKRRHDLLSKGAIVRRSGHFVLLEDLVFSTASGATSFVLGSRHHPGIWTAMPPDPAPPRV